MNSDLSSFVDRVRRRLVAQPVQREFALARWRAEASKFSHSQGDTDLASAGEWIFQHLESIRKHLKFITRTDLSSTERRRTLLAYANESFIHLKAKANTRITAFATEHSNTLIGNEVAQLSLETATGTSYSVDELVQNLVDGVERCLRAVNPKGPERTQKSTEETFEDVQWDVNLGILYRWLESIWTECVWNGFMITPTQDKDVIAPREPANLDWEVASQHRRDHLVHEFSYRATRYMTSVLEKSPKKIPSKIALIVSENGNRKTERYVLSRSLNDKDGVIGSTVARARAQELYLEDIVSAPLPSRPTVTLSLLVDAWQVLRSLARIHENAARTSASASAANPYAPLVQVSELEHAVCRSLAIDINDAKYLVARLTYHGSPGEELWAQPLVQLTSDSATFALPAILTANLSRVIGIWIRQTGFNLDIRGPLFEDFARKQIRSFAAKSRWLKSVAVTTVAVRVATPSRQEELDAVFVLGRLVVVVEAKCFLEPADAMEICTYRDKIDEATLQARRKAVALQADPATARRTLAVYGVRVPDDPTFIPLVLVNGAMHAGIPRNGVPVADLLIIEKYFEGQGAMLSKIEADGSATDNTTENLYSDTEEAERNLPNYLLRPPQMGMRLDSIRTRELPIMPFHDDMKPAVQVIRECHIDYQARMHELKPSR